MTDDPTPPAGPVRLTVDPLPDMTLGASVKLSGTVDRAATLRVDVACSTCDKDVPLGERDVDGAWTLTVERQDHVPHTLRLAAWDGDGPHITQEVNITFLAQGNMEVRFREEVPPREDVAANATLHLVEYPSTPLYGDCPISHPGFTNVLDFMEAWSVQTGVEITYSCGESGFFVESIDGHEQPGFWCYSLNGSTDGVLGVHQQRWTPGDEIIWDDCTGLGVG